MIRKKCCSTESNLSNPERYLSYTENERRPPVIFDSTSKRFEQVTTSAIVAAAGAILEKASKLTVLSTSTCQMRVKFNMIERFLTIL
jgi:hypothetical protein